VAGAAAGFAAGCSKGGSIAGLQDTGGIHLVVMSSDRNQSTGQYDVLLWDADSYQFRPTGRLNSPAAADRHPNLSPGGRFIAFTSDRGVGTSSDIYVYDRVNDSYVDVPGMNSAEPEIDPIFTGDGLSLAYARGAGVRRVRLYNGQTKQPVALAGLDTTGVSWSDEQPSPNQDASLIALVSTRNGTPDVYVYNRTQKRVLDIAALRSGADDVDPALTPDGLRLVFSSNRAGGTGGYDLYEYNFADSTLRELTVANSASDERHPAISVNGGVIMFQSDRAGGQGRWDVWNYERSSGHVGQHDGYDSPADDIEPGLRWPY